MKNEDHPRIGQIVFLKNETNPKTHIQKIYFCLFKKELI